MYKKKAKKKSLKQNLKQNDENYIYASQNMKKRKLWTHEHIYYTFTTANPACLCMGKQIVWCAQYRGYSQFIASGNKKQAVGFDFGHLHFPAFKLQAFAINVSI